LGLIESAEIRFYLFVSQSSKKGRSGPPKNVGVAELIEGKRRWSAAPKAEQSKQGYRGWHERGYLPHRDEPGLTQFVTFNLVDSFPVALRSEWEHFAKLEDDRERLKELEGYLDKARGDCFLRRPEIAQIVENNFREHAGERYELKAWVVMPNHVHVLFKVGTVSMSETIGAWKRNTGRLANRRLGRSGAFWAEDYFDVFMRDAEHEQKTVKYIENNPTKVKMVLDPKAYVWSRARLRNEFGVLKL